MKFQPLGAAGTGLRGNADSSVPPYTAPFLSPFGQKQPFPTICYSNGTASAGSDKAAPIKPASRETSGYAAAFKSRPN